eukprot:3939501-Rhodomonas_salina.1
MRNKIRSEKEKMRQREDEREREAQGFFSRKLIHRKPRYATMRSKPGITYGPKLQVRVRPFLPVT